ncbi:MAG: fibronectin type III domain-containing protein [Ferruginibacter sp.]
MTADGFTHFRTQTTAGLSSIFSGLSPDSTYSFKVSATNSGGTSVFSSTSTGVSPSSVAPVVTTTAATSITATGVTFNGNSRSSRVQ